MSVPVLMEAGALLARYDVLISDVWGVVHDGVLALGPACEALMRYREGGGTVVLLSNAPGPSTQIAGVLDDKRVPRAAWDRLVTSGDVTRALIAETHLRKAYHIGWHEDRAVFAGFDIALVGEAVEVEMMDRDAPRIGLDEGKGRTRHVQRRIARQRPHEAARERRLAGAEIAGERKDVADPRHGRQVRAQARRGGFVFELDRQRFGRHVIPRRGASRPVRPGSGR